MSIEKKTPAMPFKLRQERHESEKPDEGREIALFVHNRLFLISSHAAPDGARGFSGPGLTIDMALLRSLGAPFRTVYSTENSEEPWFWREVFDGQGFAAKMGSKLGQKWLAGGEGLSGASFVSR